MSDDLSDGVDRALDAARRHDLDELVRAVAAVQEAAGEQAIRLLAIPALDVVTTSDEATGVMAARLAETHRGWAPDLEADAYEVAISALRGDPRGVVGFPHLVLGVACCIVAVSCPTRDGPAEGLIGVPPV